MIRLPPRSTRTDPLFPYNVSLPVCCPRLSRGRRYAFCVACVPALRSASRSSATLIICAEARIAPRKAYFEFEAQPRSEEHTSELQSLMRISYAVFCLKKKNKKTISTTAPRISHPQPKDTQMH